MSLFSILCPLFIDAQVFATSGNVALSYIADSNKEPRLLQSLPPDTPKVGSIKSETPPVLIRISALWKVFSGFPCHVFLLDA